MYGEELASYGSQLLLMGQKLRDLGGAQTMVKTIINAFGGNPIHVEKLYTLVLNVHSLDASFLLPILCRVHPFSLTSHTNSHATIQLVQIMR